MIKIILLLASITYSQSIQDKGEYKKYCNERFGFCIQYPKDFVKQPESENGDGTTFISKDKKSTIWAYGRLAIEGLDEVKQEFEMATKDIKLTYKVIGTNWFVFSGTDTKGAILYQRTSKKKIDYLGTPDTYVFQTIRISYPADQNKQYEAYCKLIGKSLQ